jgi:hypothetical protein
LFFKPYSTFAILGMHLDVELIIILAHVSWPETFVQFI